MGIDCYLYFFQGDKQYAYLLDRARCFDEAIEECGGQECYQQSYGFDKTDFIKALFDSDRSDPYVDYWINAAVESIIKFESEYGSDFLVTIIDEPTQEKDKRLYQPITLWGGHYPK